MKYYKLLTDEGFIGVVNSNDFVRENPHSGWLLTSNEIRGQFVEFENKLYRDFWMQPIPNTQQQYTSIEIAQISEEEYNALKKAIDNDESIIDEDDDEEEPIAPAEDATPDELVEFTREAKLREMSIACRKTIEGGFDLELREEIHHFSLSTQDQLNLISLGALAQTQSLIPYHADNEDVIFYSNEEIEEIVDTANAFKIYHTTYHNALKKYINALETIEEIGAIEYGVEIPEEYKTDVLKALEG